MNVKTPYLNAVKALVKAALTEIPGPVFLPAQLLRINFADALTASKKQGASLETPWCSVRVTTTRTNDWGAANVCFLAETQFLYISGKTGLAAGVPDLAELIEGRLSLLSDALLQGLTIGDDNGNITAAVPALPVLITEVPEADTSDELAVNRKILEVSAGDFYAGMLTWTALIGYVPGN